MVADLAILALASGGATAAPGATTAGTPIDNIAAASFRVDTLRGRTISNQDRLQVGERLDVALRGTGQADLPDGRAIGVALGNGGNGSEAYDLAATIAGGGRIRLIAIDRDGDGRFDPARDTPLDGRSPAVAPGGALALLVVVDGAETGALLTLIARAITGSGAPGTSFDAAGDGGSVAVVGPTGAAARFEQAIGAVAVPRLVKRQAVRAPDGSARAIRGATIRYTLDAELDAPAAAVTIEDAIPAGTRFVPGSLTLDDTPLSDRADADAGSFDGARIAVGLGDVPAGTHRIQFDVIIS